MPATSIAKTSLQLTADSAKLNPELGKAQSAFGKFVSSTKSQTAELAKGGVDKVIGSNLRGKWAAVGSQAAKGIGGGLAKIGKGEIGGGLLQALGGLKAGIVGVVGGIAFGAVKEHFGEIADRIRQTAVASRELGVAPEALSALDHAAKTSGVSVEALHESLGTLQANLKREDAGDVFAGIGASVAQLKSLPTDEAFGKIADGLAGIQDPTMRAKEALRIFGEKGADLFPLLSKGSGGVAELTDEAKRLGLTVSQTDISQFKRIEEAKTRISESWTGLQNQLALTFAPMIEAGSKAVAWITTNVVGKLVEVLKWFQRQTVETLRTLGKLPDALGGSDFRDMAAKLKDLGKDAPTPPKMPGLDKNTVTMLSSINDLERGLKIEMLTIGRTSAETEVFNLKLRGASDASLKAARSLAELKKNAEIGFANVEMPPVETWERSFLGLDELLKNGRLTWDQYRQGVTKAADALMSAAGISTEMKSPKALTQGSAEAQSVITQSQTSFRLNNDPARLVQQAMRENNEIQKKQLDTANKILGELRKDGPKPKEL